MARIEEISVKNYRVLQDVTLKDIRPFSVFLGLNGSGKTTFFDVIGFLSDCLTTNVRKALEKRGRFQEVISRDCQGQEIEILIKYREDNQSPKITYTVYLCLTASIVSCFSDSKQSGYCLVILVYDFAKLILLPEIAIDLLIIFKKITHKSTSMRQSDLIFST
ncbi:AAA family ATPase [Nostoc sp.]